MKISELVQEFSLVGFETLAVEVSMNGRAQIYIDHIWK
jgi:hypothetical protein